MHKNPTKEVATIGTKMVKSFEKKLIIKKAEANNTVGLINWVTKVLYFKSLKPCVAWAEIKVKELNGIVKEKTMIACFSNIFPLKIVKAT